MAFEPQVILTGFDELQRFIGKLPASAANHLQAVEVKNYLQHRKEVVRTHGFSPASTSRIRGSLRVFPRGRTNRRRIRDVEAGIATWWAGTEITDPKEGVAARLEKRVGKRTTKPRRKQYLLIPFGDFRTATGRPRRKRRNVKGISVLAPVLIRELKNTRVVRMRDGKLRVVQRLKKGERGQFEKTPRVRKNRLGSRDRIVGILVRVARVRQGLDFFGSWDRLRRSRDERYDRMLERVIKTT